MRSEQELAEELAWYDNWPESAEIDAECCTEFDADGYMDGLRAALGQADFQRELPPVEAINTLVARVRDEYPDAEVEVERFGFPPHPEIAIRMHVDSTKSVDKFLRIREHVQELARDIESESDADWMLYTFVDPKRDE